MTKRILIIIIVLALLGGAVAVGLAVRHSNEEANTFLSSGYILTAEPDTAEKKILFNAGAAWRSMPSDMIGFKDVQGTKKEVSTESFLHYDGEMFSALSDGVIVDLNDLDAVNMTNHYAISDKLVLEGNGGTYTVRNTAADCTFSDFLWKLDEGKYMLVSDTIDLSLYEDDHREAAGFVEVSYIDNDVIQFQTEDNVWQTISSECTGTLSNGEVVDFSLRNVQDKGGNVLLDFGKIVVDSDDNVELIPLTQEMEDVAETVIPHFEITAENGKDGMGGAAGQIGVSGESGESGANGKAGAAGVNGAGGAPGGPGDPGDPGEAEEIDGEVLKFPIFTLAADESDRTSVAWEVTATGCRGHIMVEEPGDMLQPNTGDLHSEVFLIDLSTSSVIQHADYVEGSYNMFNYNPVEAAGYDFSFEGLQPDHAYLLQITAPIQVDDSTEPYLRTFISKTFWTDSTGVYMEPGSSTVSSVSASVVCGYTGGGVRTGIQLFSSYAEAYAASGTAAGWHEVSFTNNAALQTWTQMDGTGRDLSSNTKYYARLGFDMDEEFGYERLSDQILELTTLKQRAIVASPMLTANRDSWGFDLTPGKVVDPDKGVVSYTYEFYAENDVSDAGILAPGAVPVKTVTVSSPDAFVVPVDGVELYPGRLYSVRTVATFSDNEKEYSIVSGFSNRSSVEGSKLPSVYFTSIGEDDVNTQIPAAVSPFYDELVGTLHVNPGTEGSRLLVDKTNGHVPTVTVRASGYYYVQYPVYTAADAPENGDYLVATVKPGGIVEIALPQKAVTAATASAHGAVNGLKDNIAYDLIVTGDLSQDGRTVTDSNIQVGRCVAKTPLSPALDVNWKVQDDLGGVMIGFTGHEPDSDQFERQMDTFSCFSVSLYTGRQPEAGADETGTLLKKLDFSLLDLTPAEYAETMQKLKDGTYELKLSAFGVDHLETTYSAVHVTMTNARDYTADAANRVYQVYDQPYENTFKLYKASCDIIFGKKPDPLPAQGKGFDLVEPQDTDGDQDYNDSYLLHADYLNGAKLAESFTFYVFDAVDFYADYTNSNYWKLDTVNFPGVSFKTPVTVVGETFEPGDEAGAPWLGKVTVTPNADGTTPNIMFIPMTKADYAEKLDVDESSILDRDAEGNRYLFYKEESNEPETGHQFVFAWTMTYTKDTTGETAYYPFDKDTTYSSEVNGIGGKEGYLNIPHSEVKDAPHALPTVYALPWSSTSGDVTWKVYVADPDGAVVSSTLYRRQTATSALPLYVSGSSGASPVLPISDTKLEGTTSASVVRRLINEGADVKVSRAGMSGSIPTALRVQRYTDKYTASGRGLFDAEKQGYVETSFDGKWSLLEGSRAYDRDKQREIPLNDGCTVAQTNPGSTAKVLAWFGNAFTFFAEGDASISQAAADQVTVDIEPNVEEGAAAVNDYKVVVKGPASVLDNANGIRMNFFYEGDPLTNRDDITVTLDKTLSGKDILPVNGEIAQGMEIYERDETDPDHPVVTLTYRVSVSQELGTIDRNLTGKEDVDITAKLLYETEKIGFSYPGSGSTFSVLSYGKGSSRTDSGQLVLSGASRLVFSDNRTTVPQSGRKLGSFFNLSLTDSSTGSGQARVWSTRLLIKSTRSALYNDTAFVSDALLSATGVWGTGPSGQPGSGSAIVPRVLGTTGEIPIRDGSRPNDEYTRKVTFDILESVPEIEYTNTETGVKDATINFLVSGLPAGNTNIFFTLENVETGRMYLEYQYLEYDPTAVEMQVGDFSAETFLSNMANYGTVPQGGQFDMQTVLNHINDTNNGGKILCSPQSMSSLHYECLSANTDYTVRCWYWDENHEWKNASGDCIAKGAFVLLNMQRGTSGNLVKNETDFSTKENPTVTLSTVWNSDFYYPTSPRDKWISAQVSVANATNYYWTMELQDEDGNFITWLNVGNSTDRDSAKQQYYDVDGYASSMNDAWGGPSVDSGDGRMKSIPRYIIAKDGLLHDTESGRQIAKLPDTGDTPLYLEYGKNYQVKVRIYGIGSGPAFTPGYDLDEDPANLLHVALGDDGEDARKAKEDELMALASGSFSVPADQDVITLQTAQTVSETGEVRMRFLPSYASNQMYAMRDGNYTASVVRTHIDPNTGEATYYDVTNLLEYGNTGNWMTESEYRGYGILKSNTPLYLPVDPDWSGDTFTCYVYAIQGDITDGNTKYVPISAADKRAAILTDRRAAAATGGALTRDQLAELTLARLPVDATGHSIMAVSKNIEFRSESVSAGYINAVWDKSSGKMILSLNGMVGAQNISRMIAQIEVDYSVPEGTDKPRVMWPTTVSDLMLSGSTNTLQLIPEFPDLPANATINYYTLTVSFQQKDASTGEYIPVSLYRDQSSSGNISTDGSYRFTETIYPDGDADMPTSPDAGPVLSIDTAVWTLTDDPETDAQPQALPVISSLSAADGAAQTDKADAAPGDAAAEPPQPPAVTAETESAPAAPSPGPEQPEQQADGGEAAPDNAE